MERAIYNLSAAEQAEIIRRYQAGESGPVLARSFGVVPTSILNTIKRAGIRPRSLSEARRQHDLDHHAFSTETEAACYWAGFLMADGSVRPNGRTVTLALSDMDIEHVVAFKKFLAASYEIAHRRRPPPARGAVVFAFTSPQIVTDLSTIGVVAAKTHTATALRFHDNRHFWRGVVDGDGWLGEAGPSKVALHLHGSRPLMGQFASFVRSVHPGSAAEAKPHKTIFRVALSGATATSVVRALYAGAAVALPRKADKARLVLARASTRQTLPLFA
jgi:hypothetical protein